MKSTVYILFKTFFVVSRRKIFIYLIVIRRFIQFGTGTVIDADRDKGAHIVQFDNMETPRTISFRAKLEKI